MSSMPTALAALAAVLVTVGPAAASVHVTKSLAPTASAPNAKGKAKLNLRSSSTGTFGVSASRLKANQSYDVIVRGVKVGALHTNAAGSGRATFSTTPRGQDFALGFDPSGSQVDVRDQNGDDDLVGDIPDDTVDPNAVACCVPQGDGEAECEPLTPDACTTANGTAPGGASCLPDPCGSQGGSEITCCTNATADDGSEAECDRESAADCAAAGGLAVQATSCDPNPCAPTPPTATTACCIPDDGNANEVECEVTTPDSCAAQNGTAVDGGTCSTAPCGANSGNDGSDGNDGETGDS
jgi:hypothetical protein